MTQKVNFKNGNLTIAGIVFLPEGFDENKKYAALVVSHPAGGVKEQYFYLILITFSVV